MFGARFILLFFVFVEVSSLKKEYLAIEETGAEFKEKIFVDDSNNFEVIEVPAHNNLSAIKILTNFKNGYKIYSMPAAEECMVVKLPKDEEKPVELLGAVKKLNHKYPSKNILTTHYSFAPREEVPRATKIGKVAVSFCGKESLIRYATLISGSTKDELDRKMDELTNSINEKRDVRLRDFWPCKDGMIQSMVERYMCSDVFESINARCDYRTGTSASCYYTVKCPYVAGRINSWNCVGNHHRTRLHCCKYKCQPPANNQLNVMMYPVFAKEKMSQAQAAFSACMTTLQNFRATCTWRWQPKRNGNFITTQKHCRYAGPGKLLCPGVVPTAAARFLQYCEYFCDKTG